MNSIKKGKAYELKVSKILTKQTGIKFNRVPMSGAMQTARDMQDFRFKGDIFTEDFGFNDIHKVVIECKKTGKKISLWDYLDYKTNKHGQIADWIKQCIKEASPTTNVGFWLIFGSNNLPDIIIEGVRVHEEFITNEPMLLEFFLKNTKIWHGDK
jgi:hypothetical protein